MKKLLFPLLSLLLLAACSKKDQGPTRTELLTSGSWNLTASELDDDGNGTYEIDLYASFDACFKDNFVTFQSNGQMVLDEGLTKCDPNDPQTENSTWQLSADGSKLTVDGDTYDILELSNSTLRIKDSYAGGRSNRVTFTRR
jgi:Lipocalin-like domain/Prokaryotic membrane lipoprotein lipid attachment site